MKQGWNTSLEQVVRCVDNSARIMVEARVEVAADIRQRRDQWANLDIPFPTSTAERLGDGGVRLKASNANGPVNTTVNTFARSRLDAGATAPFMDPLPFLDSNHLGLVAWVEWTGTESSQVEMTQLQIYLDPQHDLTQPKNVAYWLLELYTVHHIYKDGSLDIDTYGFPTGLKVNAPQGAGFVTWDFSGLTSRPRPKLIRTGSDVPLLNVQIPPFDDNVPHTLIIVTGRKADGTRATNIGWGYDNGHSSVASAAGTTLWGMTAFEKFLSHQVKVGVGNVVPGVQVILGNHSSATVGFTDTGTANHIDLKAGYPPTQIELVSRGDVPPGASIVTQVQDDTATYQPFTDGMMLSQVPGTFANPTYQTLKMKAILSPNAAGDRTPILRGLGARAVTITDLSQVAEVKQLSQAVDPQDFHAEIPELELVAIHDGDRDFGDAITSLLSQNPIGNMTFRLWVGHDKLAKGNWLHIDDYFIDDYDLPSSYVSLKLLPPLCLVRGVLPVLTPEQDFYPSSTIDNPGGWTASGGFTGDFSSLLADAQGGDGFNPWDDSTYIRSPNAVAADIDVALPTTGAPNASLGPNLNVILQVRAALDQPSNGSSSLSITLFKNGVAVAGFPLNLSSTQIVTYTFTLTAAQVAQIGDGSGLSIKFRGGAVPLLTAPVRVTWARLTFLPIRPQLVYSTTPISTVATDLLANQAGIDQRYRGPDIPAVNPDGTPSVYANLLVGKTITAPVAGATPDITAVKTEADALAYLAGGVWISSQGRVKFVPLFDPTLNTDGTITFQPHPSSPVAYIPTEEIAEPINVTPGFKYRQPLFNVWWGYSDASGSWQGEAHGVNVPALTLLGQARLVGAQQLSDKIARWVQTQQLANAIAGRQVLSLGLGQLAWRFRTTYAHPELELGDPIAIETDRFIGNDPITGRVIAGRRWVTGFVVGLFDAWGKDICIWLPSWAAMGLGSGVQVTSSPPAPPTPSLVVSVQAIPRAGGYLTVSWAGQPSVGGVRIAWNTVAANAIANPLTDAAGDTAALGAESVSPGESALLGQAGAPFGPAATDQTGLAVVPSKLLGLPSIGAPPPGAGAFYSGQNGQTQIGPFAFGDVVLLTVTPYGTVDGTLAPGPAVSTQTKIDVDTNQNDNGTGFRRRGGLFDDLKYALRATLTDGRTTESAILTPQGSVVPVASNPSIRVSTGFPTGASAAYVALSNNGGAGSTIQFTAADGTVYTALVPTGANWFAGTNLPAPSVVGNNSGGSLATGTYTIVIGLVKNGCVILCGHGLTTATVTGPNGSITINPYAYPVLNGNLGPFKPQGFFDGWVPMWGTAGGGQSFVNASALPTSPIPFGTGFTIQAVSQVSDSVGNIQTNMGGGWGVVAFNLAGSTTYSLYPFMDVNSLVICLPGGTPPAADDAPTAALQNGDGRVPLTLGALHITTPASGGANGGSNGNGGKYK